MRGKMRVAVHNIIVSVKKNQDEEIRKHLKKVGIEKKNIKSIHYIRKSIDNRKKQDIKFVYSIEVVLEKRIDILGNSKIEEIKELVFPKRKALFPQKEVYIVGAGPAGLFAAYRLLDYGYLPIVIERGEKVEERDKTTAHFIATGELNPNSNIQFGEGGAGTHSDCYRSHCR